MPTSTQTATQRLAARLADASRERVRRAERLTEALSARARPWLVPVLPPNEPEAGLSAVLRGMIGDWLYTDADAREGARWLGSDPFGLRDLPGPPALLGGADTRTLAPECVAPLLRRLDMAGRPGSAGASGVSAAAAERAPVSRGESTGFCIPRVLHAIWLGTVPAAESAFLRNLGYVARRYAGEIDVVLWTDRARGEVPERLAEWAVGHGVALVNVFEVFHAQAPMITHAQYVLETAKQLPPGYAAASDLLRLEIVYRLGGVYADGDLEYADQDRDAGAHGPRPENLVEFLDRIAASKHGFTMNPLPAGGVGNDIVAAPARHRAVRLWLEQTRVNYFRSQPELFGGLEPMALPYVGEDRFALRYVTPHRTGRVHHRVLRHLGLTGPDLPTTQPPFRFQSAGSWIPRTIDEPASRQAVDVADAADAADAVDESGGEETLRILERCLTFLEWQTIAREGDLYLSAVDEVVRRLPDPDAAWIALLRLLPKLPGAEVITSVTDVRRREDGKLERVELPPEAEILIHRHARSVVDEAPAGWLGAGLSSDGSAVWLLDERVEAATLNGRGGASGLADVFGRLAEVAYDASSGELTGLWIRSEQEAHEWRHALRFAHVPKGWFGVSIGGPPGWDWREHWPLSGETVAELVLAAGGAGRPVMLSVPRTGGSDIGSRLAQRLSGLLGEPVELAVGSARQPGLLMRPSSTGPAPVRYLPLRGPASFR